jgi:membrane-associated phospholipid phosphatase
VLDVAGETVQRGDLRVHRPVVPVGRPPWWAAAVAVLVTALVTADLLASGVSERLDLRVSEVVSGWDLEDSGGYPALWVVTQLGGRGTLLVVLAALVLGLARSRRTWVPLGRVLLALVVLTVVVYSLKYAIGRTAPAHPDASFFAGGASYPSGHVANAVLVWGVARWQAVDYGLAPGWQHAFRWLGIAGPVATGVAMVCLDFHWVTDAVVGGAVGVLLLSVVHALDARVLSRWVRARAGRPTG